MIRIREHFRTNVIGYLALFVALSGTAWAAATIGPGDIKPNAVRSKHVKDNALKGADIAEPTLHGLGAGILGGEWKNLFTSGGSARAPAGLSAAPEVVRWLAPVPIVLTGFRAAVTTAPGSGQTRTLGISVFNASGNFVDSLSCTVSGTSTTCNSGAKKLTVPAGGFFSGSESGSSSASAAGGRFGYRVLTP